MRSTDRQLTGPDGWPAPRIAWATVTILAIAQFVNALDRYLINLLVGPIKADLNVSDTQIGLLIGFAFALFYALMGLPIGRWADTYSRRLIITCGVLFWSLMTMACGLVQNFTQLFLARTAVGAGEATLNPCGYSLISDNFPSERRAKPMGVFIVGATIGTGAVLFLGGLLIEYLTVNEVTWPLPWGGYLKPWQIAFVIVGMPGFAVAAMVQLIREPPRRELMVALDASQAGGVAAPPRIPVLDIVAYMRRHIGCFAPIFLGFALILLWLMGKQVWAPTFMMRTFGWTPSQVGLAMGLVLLFGNSLGVVAGGWFSERVARRGFTDAHLRTAFYGVLAGLPFAVAAPIVPNPFVSVLLLIPASFFGAFPFALAPAAIAAITPNQMRAQITALYLLTINLIGFGVGPTLVGALTDHVFGDEASVGMSMSAAAVMTMPAALLLLWLGMHSYRRTLEKLAAGAAEGGSGEAGLPISD